MMTTPGHKVVLGDKSINRQDIRPQDIYKHIDTSYEGFFSNRELNLRNFN